MAKKYSFLLAILLCIGTLSTFAQFDKQLKFNKSGKFKVAQFTDIHWDDNANNCDSTINTIQMVLAAEKPDLIMLSGDIVYREPAREGWISIVRIFVDAKIPWTVLMGNHDAELDMTRQEIYDFVAMQPYYVGDIGPSNISGTGNFMLPVYDANGKQVKYAVYGIDSNDYPQNQLKYGTYDWIHHDQINWYRHLSDSLKAGNKNIPVPSLAYFHIPTPEYNELIKSGNYYGNMNEGGASSPKLNSGFFTSAVEMGDILGMFVGHDHDNCFVGLKNGIALAYGRVSGWNAYGDLERGARIVEIDQDSRRFTTWIRTKEGASELFFYPSGITAEEEKTSTYSEASTVKGLKQGLRYKYFEYEGKIKTVAKLEDTSISTLKKEGILTNFSLSPMERDDFFGLHYEGYIKVPATGIYKFYTYTDDGSKLYIDDQLVVDNDGSHSARRADGRIALMAGLHKIKLEYFESYMGQSVEVGFSSKEIDEQIVSDDMLFYAK